jgi:hypothetical protein
MTEISAFMPIVITIIAVATILGTLVAGTIGAFRFFTESTSQRIARLSAYAQNSLVTIGEPNDPQGLGAMMGKKNDRIRLKPGGSDSCNDGGSCGDGGSGE